MPALRSPYAPGAPDDAERIYRASFDAVEGVGWGPYGDRFSHHAELACIRLDMLVRRVAAEYLATINQLQS